MTTNYLHSLRTKELLLILRHLQYGHEHLSKRLPKKEYRYLLAIGSLSNNQMEKVESDKQEKIGNVSVVVNTILTSCFGAWLGFNAFNHSSIISPIGALIIILGMTFGFIVGYLSYLLTHGQARLASRNLQICNVMRVIAEIIINKRQLKIDATRDKIHDLLQELEVDRYHNHDASEIKLIDCLSSFALPKSASAYTTLYNKTLAQIKRSIRKIKSHHETHLAKEGSKFNSSDFILNNALTNASYIKILTKTDLPSKNQIAKVDTWFRRNIVGILVGLLPTFLGSFASMFVFLNGLPAFLDGIHVHLGLSTGQIDTLKLIMLGVALMVSLYFAYSHIHSNYKAYRRAQLLENAENIVADKTNQMIQLMSQLNQWNKIFYHLQLIRDLKAQQMPPTFEMTQVARSVESMG